VRLHYLIGSPFFIGNILLVLVVYSVDFSVDAVFVEKWLLEELAENIEGFWKVIVLNVKKVFCRVF